MARSSDAPGIVVPPPVIFLPGLPRQAAPAPVGPALLPGIAALVHMVIHREERHLATKFGASYDDYRRRVRRWP